MPENLNELFAELKAEIFERTTPLSAANERCTEAFYALDVWINNGQFARAEQDAYIG